MIYCKQCESGFSGDGEFCSRKCENQYEKEFDEMFELYEKFKKEKEELKNAEPI